MINIHVNEQSLIAETALIVEGCENYLMCTVDFNETWTGFKKTIIFSKDENKKELAVTDGVAFLVPNEFIKAKGFEVRIKGTKDKVVLTTQRRFIPVDSF